ncbi:MAG: hypothetical protein V7724_05475 [Sediminicola sp.]|tara:strand:- start:72389 stop:72553 length:165 start_codon:yes stop_codon:yes gene_type:complete
MKKVFSILAVVALSTGLYSCEEENSMEETQALYENIGDTLSTDKEIVKTDDRDE